MDEFKEAMTKCCDIKGLKCECCNPTRPARNKRKNTRSILRQNARAKLKQKDRILVNEVTKTSFKVDE